MIFSHPEAGSIGLSTKEAIEKYGEENLKIYQSKFTAMYYAMMDDQKINHLLSTRSFVLDQKKSCWFTL